MTFSHSLLYRPTVSRVCQSMLPVVCQRMLTNRYLKLTILWRIISTSGIRHWITLRSYNYCVCGYFCLCIRLFWIYKYDFVFFVSVYALSLFAVNKDYDSARTAFCRLCLWLFCILEIGIKMIVLATIKAAHTAMAVCWIQRRSCWDKISVWQPITNLFHKWLDWKYVKTDSERQN